VESLWRLDSVGPRRYEGWCRDGGPGRVYGGQVAAQALASACLDVADDCWPESLHAYFVREGRSSGPIEYEVDGDDDPGANVRFRRVTATQGYEPVFILESAFSAKPNLPPAPDMDDADDPVGWIPDGPDDETWLDERIGRMRMDMRFATEPCILTARKGGTSDGQRFWVRADQILPDQVRHHVCAITYASDMFLVSIALATHGLGHREGIQAASVDHAIWFHRPVRADTWLLFEQTSLSTAGGRGLCAARVLDRSGELVATIRQEVLLRIEY
jgi:acyl-CoA thioesterase-2